MFPNHGDFLVDNYGPLYGAMFPSKAKSNYGGVIILRTIVAHLNCALALVSLLCGNTAFGACCGTRHWKSLDAKVP
jgi:hypothetical protein